MGAFADYQIVLIDIVTGANLDIIDAPRWEMLTYNRVLNDVSKLEFTVALTDNSSGYRDLDTIIEVYRRNENNQTMQRENTYLLRYWSIYYDESADVEYITRGAVSCEDLLKCRIIVPADDPLNAGGYSTKQDLAGVVMSEYVSQQLVAPAVNLIRAMPNFFIQSNPFQGNIIFQRRAWEVLFDVILDCSAKGNIDFRVFRFLNNQVDPPDFVFSAERIGTDKTKTANYPYASYIYFAPQRANMRQPVLTQNRYEEKNYVYVLGPGTEGAREVLPMGGDTIIDSPYNRREATTDARDIEYNVTDGFLTAGSTFLKENEPTITFEFVPDLNAPQGAYKIDWDLGDLVTAAYQGYESDFRIIKVEVTVQGREETINLELLRRSQFDTR